MNYRRLRQTKANLTSAAAKVLAVVPLQEMWTAQAIFGELRRMGVSMAMDSIHGILDHLKRDGLVLEPARGSFTAVHIPSDPDPTPDLEEEEEPVDNKQPRKFPVADGQDPFTVITTEAASLRRQAVFLTEMADRLDEAALNHASRVEQDAGEFQKLKKLGQAMKELMG